MDSSAAARSPIPATSKIVHNGTAITVVAMSSLTKLKNGCVHTFNMSGGRFTVNRLYDRTFIEIFFSSLLEFFVPTALYSILLGAMNMARQVTLHIPLQILVVNCVQG